MNVRVRYFASIREAIGQGSETVQARGETLAALRAHAPDLPARLISADRGENLRDAARVRAMACAVELEPQPAMTGIRPAATETQASMTRTCSDESSVADSPVVPQGTSP